MLTLARVLPVLTDMPTTHVDVRFVAPFLNVHSLYTLKSRKHSHLEVMLCNYVHAYHAADHRVLERAKHIYVSEDVAEGLSTRAD